jgi:glycosyltransferase involved in cell wall biosynthesis
MKYPVGSTGTGGSLMILDDCFPHPLSSFRFAEFTGLLDAFSSASVHTSGAVMKALGLDGGPSELIEAHTDAIPEHRDRIHVLHSGTSLAGQAAYCVFYHNLRASLVAINRDRTPFAFTLYPGGAFYLDDPATDEGLKRIFDSPNFRTVIVTQSLTREYLLDRKLCDKKHIQYIYGGVMPPPALNRLPAKQLYGVHKKTVDICFAAWRYMPMGIDKGYDTFIQAARILAQQFHFVRFHVIGPWDEREIDVSDLSGRVRFYAPMSSTDLRIFFRRIDLLISPNRPFMLMPGKFDAFPLGCCVEAALSGVAVCATDEMKQNGPFTHGQDILISGVRADAVAEMAGSAVSDYDRLTELANAGMEKFSEVFGWDAQLGPRLQMLSQLLALPETPPVPVPRTVTRLPAKSGNAKRTLCA